MKQAPTSLVSCCNSSSWNASCLSFSPLIFSLSFFSSHSLNQVSFSWSLTSFRSSPIFSNARPRVYGRSRVCACFFFFVSNWFDHCFELAPGFDLVPFRKMHTQKSCILPQDHGVLAFLVDSKPIVWDSSCSITDNSDQLVALRPK